MWPVYAVLIINSAIHKAAVQPAAVQNGVWRAFCTAVSFDIYSAIHKAAVQPAAVQNDLWRSFLPVAPIDSQWTLFCSIGIIPGKPVEQL